MSSTVIARARSRSGLSQEELARRAGTSRPTLSAYEHGRVSPTMATAERILDAAGFQLALTPTLRWRSVPVGRGRSVWVPDQLPRLRPRAALRQVELPLHLEWSEPGRVADLSDRRQRARVYEVVLREGRPEDIEAIVDGTLLVDCWEELVLPRGLREGWEPMISEVRGCRA